MKENLEKKQEREERKKKIQELNEPPKLTCNSWNRSTSCNSRNGVTFD